MRKENELLGSIDVEDYCYKCGEPIYSDEKYVYANPYTCQVFLDPSSYDTYETYHLGCEPSD